jgi:hypothetical protein
MAYLLKTDRAEDIRYRNAGRVNTISVFLIILISSYLANRIHMINNIQKAVLTVILVLIITYITYPIVSSLYTFNEGELQNY